MDGETSTRKRGAESSDTNTDAYNRTKKRKYTYSLSDEKDLRDLFQTPSIPWSEAEDKLLVRLRKQEDLAWRDISNRIPGRRPESCLIRFRLLSQPGFVRIPSVVDIDGEEWRRVENTYQTSVSNFGRLRSGNRLLKQHTAAGYLHVKIQFLGSAPSRKSMRVHRLVAMEFCENDDPVNKHWVDHIDGNKANCHATNLEWVTPSVNAQRAVDTGLSPTRVVVNQIDKGKVIATFSSITDASKHTGIGISKISDVICGRAQTSRIGKARGFQWKRVGERAPRRKQPEKGENDSDVEWRVIPSYPKHEASSEGDIRNRRTGRLLTPSSSKKYPSVIVENSPRLVHVLVAEAFLGVKREGMQVNHKDKNTRNACISNLEYMTISENTQHAHSTPHPAHRGVNRVFYKTDSTRLVHVKGERVDVARVVHYHTTTLASRDSGEGYGAIVYRAKSGQIYEGIAWELVDKAVV